ncbi:MAG: Asp-tRNA(Asn)/Glu-tRNA(Gln) amidotransferase subunit GatA [Solirubrobacterales bacterium]
MQLYELSAAEAAQKLAAKEVSARELMEASLGRIRSVEPKINAFLTLTEEPGLTAADRADSAGGFTGLAGIPMAVKDNMCTRGIRTTCASKILSNFIPPYDATAIEKLNAEGSVLVGKLNMDEFAMGSSTENSGFHTTRNPWNTDCVPGGSSGGAAAAVASGEVFFALGSDTGGSIRQPAALCGVVGMKPTYGMVSRYGLVAYASSLDQIGPFTRTVADCAMVLDVITGHDPLDSTSLDVAKPKYTDFLIPEIKGMRIGYPKEYFQTGVDPAVRDAVMRALKKYEELGAVVEETSLPHTDHALPAYYIIAPAEASSNLARFDGVRYGYRDPAAGDIIEMYSESRARGFGAEVKRRIMLGTYALSSGYYDAYYLKALKVRRLVRQDFDRAFEKYDLLVSPTSPTVAFKIGEKADDPLAMYMSDILTIPVNLAGLPALSMPCGLVDGLPVGLHLMGKPLSEGTVLQAAFAYEQSTDYHRARPKLEVE